MKAMPLDKIKKLKSLDEILTRSGQAISAYREQRRGGQLPSDEEFISHVNGDQFIGTPIIAETLWQKFFNNGQTCFFPTFNDPVGSIALFRETFGNEVCAELVESAEKIQAGRIDLLGFKNLYVGTEIDWHREPVSAKRSPLKHWKEFDDVDSSETGNKKIVWELNRHQHFFTLGAAYWLTGDERFGQSFALQIESWMEQNPPGMGINWASSLEVAFRSMSWIWAFHFFRESDHFTPELFKKAVKFLYCHGRHIEQYLSKYYSPNTHLTGEALGLYYLGTQLPFLDRSKHWRELGEGILFSEISKQILPDGVYFEQSTWYQRYTADFYSHFVLLRTMYGDPYYNAPAAEVENRLQKNFEHLMLLTQPDGTTPLIGDDDGGRMLPLTTAGSDDFRGSLGVGAAIFGDPAFKFVSGPVGQELFWLCGADGLGSYKAIREAEPSQASAAFPDGGYFVMRDGWADTDNYLAIDCGEVGSLSGGHGHADALSIEVAVHGKPLLVDSGTYTYHESCELRDYFRSTMAHNTLVIDRVSSSTPGSMFKWKSRADAVKEKWVSEPRFDYFAGSHDGYKRLPDPATHTRSILFLKGDYSIIRDVAETTGEHEYSLNFHFDHAVGTAISDDGKWVGGDYHRLYTFGDNGSWEQKESWISKDHGNRMNAPFLRFLSKGVGTQEFFTFILPVDEMCEPPQVSEMSMTSGRAFVIKFERYTDLFVFNDEPGTTIDNGIFASDFKYSWARLSEGESVPDELVAVEGSSLIIKGNELLGKAVDPRFAAIRRLGNDMYLKTATGRSTVSLGFVDRRKGDRRRTDSDRRQPPVK